MSKAFKAFLKSHPQSSESLKRKGKLREKVVSGHRRIAPQLSRELRGLFPTGNYLVHGTTIEGSLNIAADPEGKLKSTVQIGKNNKEFRGKGGLFGISFSYNGVGALPGTEGHLVMFVTSPEAALNQSNKLVVPYCAAEKELQLASKDYNRHRAAQVEAALDFFGFSNFLGSGVVADFTQLRMSVEGEAKESPIEKDLARIKLGNLTIEEIASHYRVEDSNLVIKPSAMESEISEGIIYAHYLLNYSKKGRQLGKDLNQLTPEETLLLEENSRDETRKIIQEIKKAIEKIRATSGVSLPAENCLFFTRDEDLERWLEVFSRVQTSPRAFITFSSGEGPMIPHWKLSEGDWQKAEAVVSRGLRKIGIPPPSLAFEKVLGRKVSEKDIAGKLIRYLKWEVVSQASEMINEDRKLKIISPQPPR